MGNLATANTSGRQIARPLKVLIPLIKEELDAGDAAGLEHYRKAGIMLIEAKDQISRGTWSGWLNKNFELSDRTAQRYMRFARIYDNNGQKNDHVVGQSYSNVIGRDAEKPARDAWKQVYQAADRVNVSRLSEERETDEREIKLRREVALQMIDLGYRAMATRAHPDRGGSRDAMARLNAVRDILKSVAATKRFL